MKNDKNPVDVTWRGSHAGAGELDELISMTSISRSMASKGGRSRDISLNSIRGSYTSRGSSSSIGLNSGMSSYSGEVGGGCRNSGRLAGVGARGNSATSSR